MVLELPGKLTTAGWQRSGHDGADGLHLVLMGGWRLLRDGEPVEVTPNGQRLLALLGLRGRQTRSRIAGTLWPESSEAQALSSLRSTLWRLSGTASDVLARSHTELALAPYVRVDAHEILDLTHRLIDSEPRTRPGECLELTQRLSRLRELLPGWYDEWVLMERERIHQLHMHALEALSGELMQSGHFGEAIDAALAAAAAEPLRETAHRAAIRAHIAENNIEQAVRHYERFRTLLHAELGVEPSADLRKLVTVSVRGHAGERRRDPSPRG